MITYEGRPITPPNGYIAIVVAKFNRTITQNLYEGAIAKLREHNVLDSEIRVAWVPGAFELPQVANRFAGDDECLAVICLGAVIRGETSHDEHINRSISHQFADLSVATGKPIIFGVLTCNTVEQAIARSTLGVNSSYDKVEGSTIGNKGAEAAEAALEMIDLLGDLPQQRDTFERSISRFVDRMKELPNPFEDKNFMDDILSTIVVNEEDEDDDDNDDRFFLPKPKKKRTTKKKNTKKK
ncbi:MAG: 6,7-dimethyl-8-ribityllumazine synthase [Planctomycetaceae bacterium]|jgi:6,7-dimethyl-8-ribityllumazine synthase|nr:6,7-dimethyl-8-ribityllumazine synthase [Planctomycetaceae bacterium]